MECLRASRALAKNTSGIQNLPYHAIFALSLKTGCKELQRIQVGQLVFLFLSDSLTNTSESPLPSKCVPPYSLFEIIFDVSWMLNRFSVLIHTMWTHSCSGVGFEGSLCRQLSPNFCFHILLIKLCCTQVSTTIACVDELLMFPGM